MATLTSSGVGLGVDVSTLVQQLVDAERAPENARLDRSESKVQAQLSAIGTFRAALSGLKTALASLTAAGAFAKHSVTIGQTGFFTATAGSSASNGSHTVEVTGLASAHKLGSGPFADADTVVGDGTLTIEVGAETFSVTIADGQDSLADIRDAINNAADNKGVHASIVNGTDGAHLVLTSESTGEDHALRVTTSGGDGGLAALVYDPGVSEMLEEKSPAADASLIVDGYSVESGSNIVSDAIEGVTLTLTKAEIGTEIELGIATDGKAIGEAVSNFVKSYNAVVATLATVAGYNATTKTGGPLLGDPAVLGISGQIRRIVGGDTGLTGAFHLLAEVGITTKVDGTLTLDSAKLDAALAQDSGAVAALFTAADEGVATRLSAAVESYLGTDGIIDARTTGANKRLDDIDKQRDALDLRMDALQARLIAQFSALDAMIAQMRTTSDYLTQQLAGLTANQ